jgi:alpha-acetolactate decarboxylase
MEIFPMKYLLLSAVIIFCQPVFSFAQSPVPFAITNYGNFKQMMHTGKTDGVVNLQEALDLPHIYAVGAIAQGAGEITVIDGQVWLDYSADGLGNAQRKIPAGEKAVLLVRAQVENWLSVKVPEDMSIQALHVFILAQAEAHGLDPMEPFPFLLEGSFYKVDWHLVNGKRTPAAGQKHFPPFNKLTDHRDQAEGMVIGFYSASNQGAYTHPGESWHLHIVFDTEEAGHLDALSVKEGALLKLPVNRN